MTMLKENNQKKIAYPGQQQKLETSLKLMTQEQISMNIVQLNLQAVDNEEVAKSILQLSSTRSFYFQNRYILHHLFNNSKNEARVKKVKDLQSKFDSIFVNGVPRNQIEEFNQQILAKNGQEKVMRAHMISLRQNFIKEIDQLSDILFEITSLKQKQQAFSQGVTTLNKILTKTKESVSESILNEVKILMKANHSWEKVNFIKQESSKFFITKNRNPLLLDFGFSRFLYKKDNLLINELIAMKIINFLNKITPQKFIMQYQIFPQKVGAFYQFVQNAQTIGEIKKNYNGKLQNYFQQIQKTCPNARKNFAQSYAGFCFCQFLLHLKDRNNENIMIRSDGSIFHIDLGFIFTSCPGGVRFEQAPFKMTKQYVQIMGGFGSDNFNYYQSLLIQCFSCLQIHMKQYIYKLKLLSNSEIECFKGYKIDKYAKQLCHCLDQIRNYVENLIDGSYDNWRTDKYDNYQYKTNGILP